MLQKEQKDFLTKDLWLASAISCLLNIEPTYRVENGKTVFIFPKNDSVYKAVADYNSGILINVYEFSIMVKKLKTEMLMRRGMEEQR